MSGPFAGAGSIDPGLRDLLARAADAKQRGVPDDKINAGIQAALAGTNYAAGIKDFPTLLTVVQKATGNPVTEPQPSAPPTSYLGTVADRTKAIGMGLFEGLTLGHGGQIAGAVAAGPEEPAYSGRLGLPIREPASPSEIRATKDSAEASYKRTLGTFRQRYPLRVGGAELAGTGLTYSGAAAAAGAAGAGPLLADALAGAATGAAQGENRSAAQRVLQGAGGAAAGVVIRGGAKLGERVLSGGLTKAEAVAEALAKAAGDGHGNGQLELFGHTVYKDGELLLNPLKQAAEARRVAVGKQVLDPLEQSHPEVGKNPRVLRVLTGEDAGSGRQSEFIKNAVSKVRGKAFDTADLQEHPLSWAEIREVRSRLYEEARVAARDGHNIDARAYHGAADRLDSRLSGATEGEYREANAQYSAAMRAKEAFDAGEEAWGHGSARNRPEQIRNARVEAIRYRGADGKWTVDPEADRNFRAGALARAVVEIGQRGGELTSRQFEKLTSLVERARFRALFADGPKGDAAFNDFVSTLEKGKSVRLTKAQMRRFNFMVMRPILYVLVGGEVARHAIHGGEMGGGGE